MTSEGTEVLTAPDGETFDGWLFLPDGGCPDVFWRTERGVAHDEQTKIGDLLAALAHLRALPEVGGGKVAVMGYCLGGRLAYEIAAAGDPDACVSYYGSGIGDRLEDTAASVDCPVLFHYGASDPYIPNAEVDAVRAAFADRSDVEVHQHEGAGHAFENFEAPLFFSADAAEASWAITTTWLEARLAP